MAGVVQIDGVDADGIRRHVKVSATGELQLAELTANIDPTGLATSAKQDTGNNSLGSIKTAVETIDNFISGSKGLVTEDNSGSIKTAVEAINTALQNAGITQAQLAAIVTALQIIDNMISGNEAQVDVVASLPAGDNNIGNVDVVTLPGWTYKGTSRKTMAGAAQEVTIASGTKFAHIFAEGGDIRFAVNTDATSSSAGYIIGGGMAVVHLVSATKLSVYGATGSYANVMMYG